MSEKKQFTIQEFAHLTGIKRDNLRFYDRIGLLSPQTRGDNQYRYYSRMQLNNAYLIYTLRSLGVSIDEIRQYLRTDTSQDTLTFFLQQQQRVAKELKRLQETSGIIELYTRFIQEALDTTENTITLKQKQQESLFLCPIIPDGMDEDEACIMAYDYANTHHINTGHPLGAIISQNDIMRNDVSRIQRYYFLLHHKSKAVKAAGQYVVAYSNSRLENMISSYEKMMNYIDQHDLQICGDAYEEYLLDDFSLPNQHQQNVRIELPVCHK